MITFVLINVRMSFMHILNEQTRETLSRKLGKTYDEILRECKLNCVKLQ